MAGSSAEREIRDYAAARLRQMLPDARIIHELVVGRCRADLAAVELEQITLVEIKSERDTLDRLDNQLKSFSQVGDVIVIAHEKWFDTTPYDTGHPRHVPGPGLARHVGTQLWSYPEVPDRKMYGRWTLSPWRHERAAPRSASVLALLWRTELLVEAQRHRIACGSRSTVTRLVRDMAWHMTGAEIARAVCRQLRQRRFPEADAPMIEREAA